MRFLNKYADSFFYVYADCVPVKGYQRSTLNDLSKKQIHFIPNSYYPLFDAFRKYTIREICSFFETGADQDNFSAFLDFLLANNLGTFVNDVSLFPPIEMEWDHPSFITNAIIDCNSQLHDFAEIFNQLNELGCKNCQVRCYHELPVHEIELIVKAMPQTASFQGMELYLKYTPDLTEEVLRSLVNNYKMLTLLVVHSAPQDEVLLSEWHDDGMPTGKILLIKQMISSCDSCGIINLRSFHVPDVKGFAESMKFNSCLNRKISVDVDGAIKNCPSMKRSFGNIKDTTLRQALTHPDFAIAGNINKDQVKVCCDCELRYVCTDCRAYLSDNDDAYSKPAKCSYNPYTAVWES